jgi:Aldehyde dehydrogenase family
MSAAVSTELKTIGHWIGGETVPGGSGRSGPVYNPATGEQSGEVAFASIEEIDRAVATAQEAFASWRTVSLSKRADLFFRIHDLFDQHRDDLARLLTAEHGKVLSDAHGEVQRGLEVIEYVCGIPTLLKGSYSEQAATGIDVYSIRQPLGVVAGITPFNFPAMVPMWMFPVALACGNLLHPQAIGARSFGVAADRRTAHPRRWPRSCWPSSMPKPASRFALLAAEARPSADCLCSPRPRSADPEWSAGCASPPVERLSPRCAPLATRRRRFSVFP